MTCPLAELAKCSDMPRLCARRSVCGGAVIGSLQAALAGGLLEALLAKGLGVGHAGVRVHGMLRSSFVTLVADEGLREGYARGTCERKLGRGTCNVASG